MKDDLDRLALRINAIKRAPMFGAHSKVQAAELALEDALHLLQRMAYEIEQLKGAAND